MVSFQFAKKSVHRALITKLRAVVDSGMASCAKGDQILLRVVPGLAAEFLVMHLKIRHRAATLASPAVSLHDLLTELFVQVGSESQPRVLWSNLVHDAFSRA